MNRFSCFKTYIIWILYALGDTCLFWIRFIPMLWFVACFLHFQGILNKISTCSPFELKTKGWVWWAQKAAQCAETSEREGENAAAIIDWKVGSETSKHQVFPGRLMSNHVFFWCRSTRRWVPWWWICLFPRWMVVGVCQDEEFKEIRMKGGVFGAVGFPKKLI